MPCNSVNFWETLNQIGGGVQTSNKKSTAKQLMELYTDGMTGDPDIDSGRHEILALFARKLDIELPARAEIRAEIPAQAPPDPEPVPVPETYDLPAISGEGTVGISVVTCAMNRTENLLKALDTWIVCEEINEIVIVDWSSDIPVSLSLQEAGVGDPRIRVIRVENEPRWILSYAFNVGFRVARFDKILKMDADILLDREFFDKTPLPEDCFVAGNWRTAATDQSHVNGFFYAHKKALAAIGGFNEYIKTYGWDDDDLYDRLTEAGQIRHDVIVGMIYHQPHSDTERTGDEARSEGAPDKPAVEPTASQELGADTLFLIRRNRLLSWIMPHWTATSRLAKFQVQQTGEALKTLRREPEATSPVPEHIFDDAGYYARLEMTAWRLGEKVRCLTRDKLELLLAKPFSKLGPLDVEMVLSGHPDALNAATQGYLVVDLPNQLSLTAGSPSEAGLGELNALAQGRGRVLVLRGPFSALPDNAATAFAGHPFVPGWESLGRQEATDISRLCKGLPQLDGKAYFAVTLNDATIRELTLQSPEIQQRRPKLYVDAQHGLGNRMRAIGSGASIAAQSGRELVIVWEPDHHCDCRLTDLFQYDGPVIEQSFYQDADTHTFDLYNYMEIEEGGLKDAKIILREARDTYLRSAYVFVSPLSEWTRDCQFLRALEPVPEVLELVAGVPTPNDLSAHIRMVGGTDHEHLAYEARDNWSEEGHMQMDFWRRKSHFSHFMKRIDTLIDDNQVKRFFLAADKPEIYAEFKERYGDRLAMLERDVYDRSLEQLRYGLADAILLGSSRLLLGSTWSSFSELAMRLAPHKMTIEMSGTDF